MRILGPLEPVQKRHRPWMTWWLTLVVVLGVVRAFTPPSTDRCDVAQSRCVQNPSCLPVLRRYLTYCSDLIDGPAVSSVCWPRCRRTLPLLVDIPDGRAFVGCDCQLNPRCLEQRQRLKSCSRGVSHSPAGALPLRTMGRDGNDCSETMRFCMDDKSCQDALTIANVVCSGVERRGRCDRACRTSLRTLYGVNHGRQLKSCRCDDLSISADPEMCSALRQTTKTLCHKRRSKHPPSVTTGLRVITVTPSVRTLTRSTSPLTPTAQRHVLHNVSIDLRMFQRSGADAAGNSGPLVTELIPPTSSGSADGEMSIRGADRNARMYAPAATSHVTRVETKMASASDSARNWRTINSVIVCWILSFSVLGVV